VIRLPSPTASKETDLRLFLTKAFTLRSTGRWEDMVKSKEIVNIIQDFHSLRVA
jgi:hypothetical protein